jgi:lysophospholipase L1-like esterase
MVHQSIGKIVEPILGIPPMVDLKNIREDWAEFTDFNDIAEKLVEYKKWLIKFGRLFNLKVIDFSFEGMDYEKFKTLYLDGIHLNEKGQEEMADIFYRSIKEK